MNRLTAKRSLGQNWLVNEGVAGRIVAAAELSAGDAVLEVGPGEGVLTARLAVEAERVIAIEKDSRLIGPLRERFVGTPGIEIREEDALTSEPSSFGLAGGSYVVVANLPYYITSRFIRTLLAVWPRPKRAVLMVQKEVARRMVAAPPDMNLLALSVQLYADVEKVVDVSRGSFRPVPDVDSTVVRLTPKQLSDKERATNEAALAVAKRAFGQRRKQLTATVDVSGLERCAIDPSARPQELHTNAWTCLAGAEDT